LFPDIETTIREWRKITQAYGFTDLYLCLVESFNKITNPETLGFDAAIEFAPHQVIRNRLEVKKSKSLLERLGARSKEKADLDLRDFKKGVEQALDRKLPDY